MRLVILVSLLLLTACGPTNTKQPFTDWSYRTRDREHNRYEGYSAHHVREEQWQTDPYWTQGEGLARRERALAEKLERAVEAREKNAERGHSSTTKQRMPMPGKPVMPPEEKQPSKE